MAGWREVRAWRMTLGALVCGVAVAVTACGATEEGRIGQGTGARLSPVTEPPGEGSLASDATAGAIVSGETPGATEPAQPTPMPAPGTDEEYVEQLCVAMERFFGSFESATRGITPADPAGIAREFASAIGPALSRFAEDVARANPPEDVRQWHDEAVTSLREVAEAIEGGEGLGAIARLGDRPLPTLPDDLRARLIRAADAARECARFEDAFE